MELPKKLELLETMPNTIQEIELVIEMLNANYDSKLCSYRNNQWARFISNLPLTDKQEVFKEELILQY
jgi:hypothetical protein